MTDEQLEQMAEAFWQDDLAKFMPTLKRAPGAYVIMFKAGYQAALHEAEMTAELTRTLRAFRRKTKNE